jgi:hypothetical protein
MRFDYVSLQLQAAAELLQKYMKNQQQIIAENKNDKKEAHLNCKDELKVRKIYMNNALLLNKWSERFLIIIQRLPLAV